MFKPLDDDSREIHFDSIENDYWSGSSFSDKWQTNITVAKDIIHTQPKMFESISDELVNLWLYFMFVTRLCSFCIELFLLLDFGVFTFIIKESVNVYTKYTIHTCYRLRAAYFLPFFYSHFISFSIGSLTLSVFFFFGSFVCPVSLADICQSDRVHMRTHAV